MVSHREIKLPLWWVYLSKPDKSRYLYFDLPSSEEKRRWEDKAKEACVPLSRFVIEIVENAMADEEGSIPRRRRPAGDG
jgi:hypothetical protein